MITAIMERDSLKNLNIGINYVENVENIPSTSKYFVILNDSDSLNKVYKILEKNSRNKILVIGGQDIEPSKEIELFKAGVFDVVSLNNNHEVLLERIKKMEKN